MKSKKIFKTNVPYLDTLIFIVLIALFFGYTGYIMGIANMFSTLMNTAYKLLMDTVFYIMAIAVLAGAFGKMATEFGLVYLLNKIFAPLMKPLYSLPGVSFLGVITTYLSDNPAIISLAKEEGYLKYFKKHQIPCLCNLGTAFGMGLILSTFMIGLGFFKEALIGNLGAIVGSIVSVRIMSFKVKKTMVNAGMESIDPEKVQIMEMRDFLNKKDVPDGAHTFFERLLTSLLEGGKLGVDIGLSIIPGVVIICTLIMILTFGPQDPAIGYQGKAFEGVRLLPEIGKLLSPVIRPLFGFNSPEAIAFPITALGAVGAALSLVPKFLAENIIGSNEIAVFTAMGMCWSGFLSTHVAMMDALNHRELISKAITSHFIGGLVAGIAANFFFKLLTPFL